LTFISDPRVRWVWMRWDAGLIKEPNGRKKIRIVLFSQIKTKKPWKVERVPSYAIKD